MARHGMAALPPALAHGTQAAHSASSQRMRFGLHGGGAFGRAAAAGVVGCEPAVISRQSGCMRSVVVVVAAAAAGWVLPTAPPLQFGFGKFAPTGNVGDVPAVVGNPRARWMCFLLLIVK